MNRQIQNVLAGIADEYRGHIADNGRNYVEIDIGKRAEAMGYPEVKERYHQAGVIVPLKDPVPGMKVRIDGRTFVNYAQYDSGIAVPGYIAKDAGMAYKTFIPNDSMILNFA
ncbi:MAG: hypothetical protein C4522_16260 [Desulfobacteraceae bacterium]|nr:MAG: hypothetical protein C4522_16260 [Desulfobacteraceae bacterium]